MLYMEQELIKDNEFLREENKRLNNEMTEHYFAITAKANLLDIVIVGGFITQTTLDKCINQLDDIDQIVIKKEMKDGNDQ